MGERGEEIGGEYLHHEETMVGGGGAGSLVCVPGCEEEEETFWGGRGLCIMEEGGGCDVQVRNGGRIEGGIEDVESLRRGERRLRDGVEDAEGRIGRGERGEGFAVICK